MNVAMIIAITVLALFLFVSVFNASSSLFKPRNGRTVSVFLLNLCLFFIAFAYLLELLATQTDLILNGYIIKQVAMILFPAIQLYCAMDFLAPRRWKIAVSLTLFLVAVTFSSLFVMRPQNGFLFGELLLKNGMFFIFVDANRKFGYDIFRSIIALSSILSIFMYSEGAIRHKSAYGKAFTRMAILSILPILGVLVDLTESNRLGIHVLSLSIMTYIALYSFELLKSRFGALANELQSQVFQLDRDPMILVDRDGRLVDYNLAAERLFDELDDSTKGLPLSAVLKRSKTLLDRINHPMKPDFELSVGELTRIFEIHSKTIQDRNDKRIGTLTRLIDVGERRRQSEDLVHLATRDSLTGLLNRRQFLSLATLAAQRDAIDESGYSILFFDLDRFLTVNANFGPLAGDEVLKSIGRNLTEHFRKSDLIGRYSGEAFCVLLSSITAEEALKLAERFCEKIRSSAIRFQENEIRVTISAGVASTDATAFSLDDVLRNAENALRQSKENGRDRATLYR